MRLIVSNRISTTVCCWVPLLMCSSRCRAIAAQIVTTASAQLQHETDFWSLVACPHKNNQAGVYLQPDPGRLTTCETLWLHELTPLRCINIAFTLPHSCIRGSWLQRLLSNMSSTARTAHLHMRSWEAAQATSVVCAGHTASYAWKPRTSICLAPAQQPRRYAIPKQNPLARLHTRCTLP
jgi:hypothetical protein